MSSASGVMPSLAFGWRANVNADGFEQEHGRFTIEVFWNENNRTWGVTVWGMQVQPDQTAMLVPLREGYDPDLASAKKAGLRFAAILEKEASKTDAKRK